MNESIDLSGRWRFELSDALPPAFKDRVHLPGSLQCQGFGNASGTAGRGILTAGETTTEAAWNLDGGTVEMTVPLGADAPRWDEFHPHLHRLTIRLGSDEKTVVFGLRQAEVLRHEPD